MIQIIVSRVQRVSVSVMILVITSLVFLPTKAYALFSMKIDDISPTSVLGREQEVNVNVSINSLPSPSYFRVAWQKADGEQYFGYVQDNAGSWVNVAQSQNCSAYYYVSDTGISSLVLKTKIGDENYPENGNYILKVRRYTQTCGSNSDTIAFPVEVILPTPVLEPIQSPTPSPASTSYKSTYKINKPKDPTGKELSGIQIYVDGAYIHHEDDEILYFFNGHECYTGIDCDLGTHTISLRKSGYISWEDTQNFSAGSNFEVNPVLDKLESSSPTASPTVSPTPTKTLKPTPTKTPTPTDTPASESAVLGIKEEIFTPLPSLPSLNAETDGKKTPFLPILFIIAGLSFIAVPIFSIIRNGKKDIEVS